MSAAFDKIEHELAEALKAARMEQACFGFPNDRVKVLQVHSGELGVSGVHEGDVLHPDEYIQPVTKLYRESWIVGPIERALAMVKANRELFEVIEQVSKSAPAHKLERIAALMRAGRGES